VVHVGHGRLGAAATWNGHWTCPDRKPSLARVQASMYGNGFSVLRAIRPRVAMVRPLQEEAHRLVGDDPLTCRWRTRPTLPHGPAVRQRRPVLRIDELDRATAGFVA